MRRFAAITSVSTWLVEENIDGEQRVTSRTSHGGNWETDRPMAGPVIGLPVSVGSGFAIRNESDSERPVANSINVLNIVELPERPAPAPVHGEQAIQVPVNGQTVTIRVLY